ncbi:hypothetical protein A3A60_03950 [Candidatus Curtissbacteria bacterium RIFCSPLOWO2_01_FULL_42_26]|uniref:ATPase F1/V1/A1 complex alpha/beta subunit nucleotide-binding domain-containing protein n=1 Tax=Candidatus Curtissbacteria bacterium RIFCSPLOWO2_01_FULL_42_26 TaxID=1797729 RepID=A0A1F5HYL8_9BACT|nr:MAG: hypothetical protein A3A60_03950 [Candidatus Curtissbacteria bacterium RIFCSPLOWO2_01_FULL_42_26]
MKDFTTYYKETAEIGYVQSISSSLFYVNGLPNARINELIMTENGVIGIVKALLPELVEAMVFEGQSLVHNMKVVRTNEFFQVPATDLFLGRILDPFGITQDHLEKIDSKSYIYRHIESPAPIIAARVRITKPLVTGVMVVDLLTPLGRGQRELILGDPSVGKSSLALQTIVSQAKLGTICIYALIGKRKSDIKRVEEYLTSMNVLKNTIVLAASSSDPAPMIYITPYSAMAIAEYFRDKGKEVLVVLDDLSTHAKFYRELSLLSRMPPGRQSYPGDIFHIQAKIAERAGNVKLKNGKVASITLLPIAETQEGDLSGYIQTNLMAMTDGHIFLDVAEWKKPRHPAVSLTLSVSRVGNQTRTALEREIAYRLHQLIAQAKRAEELGRFGVELADATMQLIANSSKLEAMFNQDPDVILSKELQLICAGLFLSGFWNQKPNDEIARDVKKLGEISDAGTLDKIKLDIAGIGKYSEFIALVRANHLQITKYMNRTGKLK